MTRLTIKALQKLRDDGVKIAVLTCYDASFAAMLDAAGLEIGRASCRERV